VLPLWYYLFNQSNVQQFVSSSNHEQTLQKFQEMIQKYKFMENHLLQRQQGLRSKKPEIKKSLETSVFLEKRDETITDFELNDTLWVKVKVKESKTVNLWLGANVMLEYPINEAIELLSSKLTLAEQSLVQVEEDLEYLKEQITTMEVNMARVYNDEVKTRRDKK
jgi:prefoldin subunit 5